MIIIRYLYILLSGIILLTACQEEIEFDLPDSTPKLVIEGLVTNQPGPYVVKLHATTNYFSKEPMPGISDAIVTISDDAGNTETLQESEKGIYKTTTLQGVEGRTYTLNIKYNGLEYEATNTLIPVPEIDSLEYRFVEETPLKDEGYYIYFYGKTDKRQINYYRWLIFENDSLYDEREDYLLGSDEFVQERINGFEFPYEFEMHDTVKIEMYSLNEDMFTYYNALVNLLFNDGGLFSPPPANPPTNIKNLSAPENEPLGYFQVSAVSTEEVIISD